MNLASTLQALEENNEYIRLDRYPFTQIELKYASQDNFMGTNVYGDFDRAFLHAKAAEKFGIATSILSRLAPGYQFIVFDALRPRSVQRILWSHVEGTPFEIYVAQPDRGSMHNYGCAIDLSLLDPEGKEVDMGSGFDSFIELSQPKLEERFLESGQLSQSQLKNRLILRQSMTEAGFIQLQHEWWHFDAFPQPYIRENFVIVE